LVLTLTYSQLKQTLRIGKAVAGAVGIVTFIFGVYQFYDANREKRIERSVAQVERFQAFAANEAKNIASVSKDGGRTYDLNLVVQSSDAMRALKNFFNLVEGIAYQYHKRVVDRGFMDDNLLCSVVKPYRIFVLARTGLHGTVSPLNNGGIFPIGTFENLDKLYDQWSRSEFKGASVDNRCSAQWRS
jgi:hypothetical protein